MAKTQKAESVEQRSLRDYVRLAAPEPEVLRLIGEESKEKGTDKITMREIDRIIRAWRAKKSKRR